MDNLLSNAIKFSPKESLVAVTLGEEGGYFYISIKDQGPGFTEEDQRSLFQKFKKLSARPTAGESSNGLGLAIVKTLVDRLDGNIELKTQVRHGSEFFIRFPLRDRVGV
jgi:signal transduction histidine kinase